MNIVVLHGPCSVEPEVRLLPSGGHVMNLALRVEGSNGRATSVPVCVWDPPAWLETVGSGDELVVLGRVVRRFFRTAGGPGSRVEVVADAIEPATRRRQVDALLRRARARFEAFGEPGPA